MPTTEEKRMALAEYCSPRHTCKGCPLEKWDTGACIFLDETCESRWSDYLVNAAYDLMFVVPTMIALKNERTETMTRAEILTKAAECVSGQRVDDYGKPENNFAVIAEFWSAYTKHIITAHDVAVMMALLKIARTSSGHGKTDNYIDLAGYAACAGELIDNG